MGVTASTTVKNNARPVDRISEKDAKLSSDSMERQMEHVIPSSRQPSKMKIMKIKKKNFCSRKRFRHGIFFYVILCLFLKNFRQKVCVKTYNGKITTKMNNVPIPIIKLLPE